MSDKQQNGSCHCGAVELEFPKQAMFNFSCHCQACQKLVSGGRLLGFGVPEGKVKSSGELAKYTYAGGSGKDITLHFCPKCSTQLFAKPLAFEGTIVVRSNALEDPSSFVPDKFLFTEEGCSWDRLAMG